MATSNSARQEGRGAGSQAAADSTAVNTDEAIFTCSTEKCGKRGPAEQMYNRSCDPMTTSRADMLKKILCRDCAADLSRHNGKRLCEPGSGVYRLNHTLRKMAEDDSVRARREDLARWVIGKKAERDAALHAQEDERRRNEMRQSGDDMVRRYARSYAESSEVSADPGTVRPQPRLLGDGKTHVCGLPIPCCRHDRPAECYITSMGEVVGICRRAAGIFVEVFRAAEAEGDRGFRKLLWTRDLKKATYLASRWLGEEPPADDEE